MTSTTGTSGQIRSWSIKTMVFATSLCFAFGAVAQEKAIATRGATTALTVPANRSDMAALDFVNAKPKELPAIARFSTDAQQDLLNALTAPRAFSSPAHATGARGTGTTEPIALGAPAPNEAPDVVPEEFGTNNHPFSTARVDLSPAFADTSYPNRAAGRLFFNISGSTFVCSASLIKRGVIVTAAHCVANFGQSQFYSNWAFVPAYRNGLAPFGVWTARTAIVMTSYFLGTDSCAVSGIVCQDDVAVIVLNASATGAYPGTSTGWLGYGWNGYGFTASALTQISQLGYPVCLDNGGLMERNDSYGYTNSSFSNNTIIGSLMCGGSSGGPWVVNLGIRPVLTGTTAGAASAPDIVVGVTSWGYVSTLPKEQGASPFTSGNIIPLVNAACGSVPGSCS